MSVNPGIIQRVRAENAPKPGVSTIYTTPAPMGGLNAQDPLPAMPEGDAVVLENIFPRPTYVQLRNGSVNWLTGLPGWCESLMAYGSGTGRQLWAAVFNTGAASGSFYNATTQGAAPAPAVTGLTNARFEHSNMGTPGGQYLIAANASDPVYIYNGSVWQAVTATSTPFAITGLPMGVTTSNLRAPTVWKNRLFFIQDETFVVWYLGTQDIAGPAVSIDFGSQFRLGGSLQAIVTCTVDSASQIDDYLGFLSTEGELVLYRGTDPAEAGLFNIVGTFRIGIPVGRRCWFKYGADTVLITSDGYVQLSNLLTAGDETNQNQFLSYKIQDLVNTDIALFGQNFGWQGIVYPLGNKIIINVCTEERGTFATAQYQYVMNTISKAWCKFTGWLGECWEVMGDQLFYGGNGVVVQADTGFSDNSAAITGQMKPAFSYMNSHMRKLYTMVKPLLQVNGQLTIALSLNVDFEDIQPTGFPTFSGGNGGAWNSSPWNTTPWGTADVVQKNWQTISGDGVAATAYIVVTAKGLFVRFYSFDWCYKVGGMLG